MKIPSPFIPSSRDSGVSRDTRHERMVLRATALAFVLPALIGCATVDRDAFVGSAGVSTSQHSAITPLGELNLVGTLAETRVSLPAGFYGLLQLRNERGEGVQLGQATNNDYFRTTMELGWDFSLPFGFTGGVGANFVQADLDIEIFVDGTPLSVAVNRENYGGRLRLARQGEWLSIAGDLEISPVEEAIAGIFELESGRRFGPWSVALRYGQFPEITQMAALLRYRFGGGYTPPATPQTAAPAPAPVEPRPSTLEELEGETDASASECVCKPRKRPEWFEPGEPYNARIICECPRKRPEWLDEKKEPDVKYVPKKLPDGRPEWFGEEERPEVKYVPKTQPDGRPEWFADDLPAAAPAAPETPAATEPLRETPATPEPTTPDPQPEAQPPDDPWSGAPTPAPPAPQESPDSSPPPADPQAPGPD